MSHRCRVVVVDDHAVVRVGIKSLIERTERYEVVGEADSGEAAVQCVGALRPDLVVMDIRMPGIDGITATRKILDKHPCVRVLVFSAYDAPEHAEAVIKVGAMGFVSKRKDTSQMVDALDMLASGRMTFPGHVTRLWSKRGDREPRRYDVASLSERQREALFLTVAGYTASQIAQKLGLSPKTIANYRISLKKKLGVKTRVGLMRVVVESGHISEMLRAAGIGRADP